MVNLRRLASSAVVAFVMSWSQAKAKPYTGLYVLGDSFSDQGNLFVASTALEVSSGQPAQPARDHYFDGRFSNGLIYADVLAFGLQATLTPSLLGGNNFAFGGALTNSDTVEAPPFGTGIYPQAAYPWSLNAQRQAFAARAAAGGVDPDALYVVFSGLNDVASILRNRFDPATTIATTVEGIIDAVDAFKAAGARTVLVPNLPDEGLLPTVTALEPVVPGISVLATEVTAAYNAALATALDQVTGIRVIRFDAFHLLQEAVAHPSRYGFSNATQPCYSGTVLPDPGATVCDNPNQYVFWDGEHPTSAFQTLLGAEMLVTVAIPQEGL